MQRHRLDLRVNAGEVALCGRERDPHGIGNGGEPLVLDVTELEHAARVRRELGEDRFEARERFVPLLIESIRRRQLVAGRVGRHETEPPARSSPTELRSGDPNADPDDEAAKRGRLAERGEAVEEAEEYLLNQIVEIAHADRAAEPPPHERRVLAPDARLRARITRTRRVDERRVLPDAVGSVVAARRWARPGDGAFLEGCRVRVIPVRG